MDYTVSLALVDFIPVIFSAMGLVLIAQMLGSMNAISQRMAKVAAALIVLGGLSKATWKLIIATTGSDITVLDNLLFIFLAPGFTLLAWALWSSRRRLAGKAQGSIWLRPLIIIILVGLGALLARLFQPDARTWVFFLLGLTTIANVAAGIMLIQQARQHKLMLAAVLFLFNLVIVFALSGLARIPEQTIALQWIEESLNVSGQGAFAFGAWKLRKETAVNPNAAELNYA